MKFTTTLAQDLKARTLMLLETTGAVLEGYETKGDHYLGGIALAGKLAEELLYTRNRESKTLDLVNVLTKELAMTPEGIVETVSVLIAEQQETRNNRSPDEAKLTYESW